MTTDIDVFDALKYRVEVDEFGTRRYYNFDGKLHRVEGPAIVYTSGTQEWYQNGKLHRIGGPAAEWMDGTQWWCQNGELHREDGPAIENADGSVLWYLHGKQYSKTRFYQQLNFLKGVSSE